MKDFTMKKRSFLGPIPGTRRFVVDLYTESVLQIHNVYYTLCVIYIAFV